MACREGTRVACKFMIMALSDAVKADMNSLYFVSLASSARTLALSASSHRVNIPLSIQIRTPITTPSSPRMGAKTAPSVPVLLSVLSASGPMVFQVLLPFVLMLGGGSQAAQCADGGGHGDVWLLG